MRCFSNSFINFADFYQQVLLRCRLITLVVEGFIVNRVDGLLYYKIFNFQEYLILTSSVQQHQYQMDNYYLFIVIVISHFISKLQLQQQVCALFIGNFSKQRHQAASSAYFDLRLYIVLKVLANCVCYSTRKAVLYQEIKIQSNDGSNFVLKPYYVQ